MDSLSWTQALLQTSVPGLKWLLVPSSCVHFSSDIAPLTLECGSKPTHKLQLATSPIYLSGTKNLSACVSHRFKVRCGVRQGENSNSCHLPAYTEEYLLVPATWTNLKSTKGWESYSVPGFGEHTQNQGWGCTVCDPLFKPGSSLFGQCSVCQCRHIQRNLTVQRDTHLPVRFFSFRCHLDDTSAMLYSKSGSIVIIIISHLSITVITALAGLAEAGINWFPAW